MRSLFRESSCNGPWLTPGRRPGVSRSPLTTCVEWHDLPRIHSFFGVKDFAHRMHCPKRLRIEDQRHIPELVDPDTMFASDRATGRDAGLHDLRARGFDALLQRRVGRVERDVGVE